MNPKPIMILRDNKIRLEKEIGKQYQTIKLEELSEKELLFRQVMLLQSIRTMMIFFVFALILQIIGGIAIILNIFR